MKRRKEKRRREKKKRPRRALLLIYFLPGLFLLVEHDAVSYKYRISAIEIPDLVANRREAVLSVYGTTKAYLSGKKVVACHKCQLKLLF